MAKINRYSLKPPSKGFNKKIYPTEPVIYRIVNMVNNKCYVGQTTCFRKRVNQHFRALKNNKHCSIYLQNSFNKHGIDSYYVEILEIVSKETICDREIYWIEYYKSYDKELGYNILVNAPSPWYGKRSEKHCKNISNALTGKTLSEEHKLNISKALYGMPKKRSNTKNNYTHYKKVLQLDKNLNLINEFKSTKLAAINTSIGESSIRNNLCGLSNSSGGFIWKYKNIA